MQFPGQFLPLLRPCLPDGSDSLIASFQFPGQDLVFYARRYFLSHINAAGKFESVVVFL